MASPVHAIDCYRCYVRISFLIYYTLFCCNIIKNVIRKLLVCYLLFKCRYRYRYGDLSYFTFLYRNIRHTLDHHTRLLSEPLSVPINCMHNVISANWICSIIYLNLRCRITEAMTSRLPKMAATMIDIIMVAVNISTVVSIHWSSATALSSESVPVKYVRFSGDVRWSELLLLSSTNIGKAVGATVAANNGRRVVLLAVMEVTGTVAASELNIDWRAAEIFGWCSMNWCSLRLKIARGEDILWFCPLRLSISPYISSLCTRDDCPVSARAVLRIVSMVVAIMNTIGRCSWHGYRSQSRPKCIASQSLLLLFLYLVGVGGGARDLERETIDEKVFAQTTVYR